MFSAISDPRPELSLQPFGWITSAKSRGCRSLLGFVLSPPEPIWHFGSLSVIDALVMIFGVLMSVARTLRGMRDRSQTVSNAMTDLEFKFRRVVLPLRRRLSGVSEEVGGDARWPFFWRMK